MKPLRAEHAGMHFMEATPGITEPHFARDPLGTEGEMTPGPDDENPYDEEGTFGGDSQPDLPPFVGGDVPLGGDTVVNEMDDAADDRNDRLEPVFDFSPGIGGAFDPEPLEQGDQFMW